MILNFGQYICLQEGVKFFAASVRENIFFSSFWLGKVKGVNFDDNKIAQNFRNFFAIFCAVFYLWCPKLIRNHIICINLYTIIEWIDRSAVFNTR